MTHAPEVPLSADEERSFAAVFERAARGRGRTTRPSQLMFYHPAAYRFAFAWASVADTNRWIIPVEPPGPRFFYYNAKRLQDLGMPALQVLVATKGAGALFYAAPDDAAQNSSAVVGELPLDTTPADFGSTIARFTEPGPTITILSNSTAGDIEFGGRTYKGTDLMVMLAAVMPGVVRATDGDVTLNPDGTAVTAGNIWRCDPAGDPYIEFPAPGEGQMQPYPLGPAPVTA